MKFLLIIIIVCMLCACPKPQLTSSSDRYPANAISSGVIKLLFAPDDTIITPQSDIISVISINNRDGGDNNDDGGADGDGGTTSLRFRSTLKSGTVVIETKKGLKFELTFFKVATDIDEDGFPDSAELITENDRYSFREWFVRIAEAQFLKSSHSWSSQQQDCAGLIRFAYKEALRRHDEEWSHRTSIPVDKNMSDVERFNYPDIPVLGKKIFKVHTGLADDLSSFSSFANTAAMIAFTTVFVTKDFQEAQHGDVLFYYDKTHVEYPYHSMIVSRRAGEIHLIYHTGQAGVVKRVKPAYLMKSRKFRPLSKNSNFLGVYRFKIVE